MTQARRAKRAAPRRRRAWLLIAIPLVMLVAGTLIFLAISRRDELARLPIPGASTNSASTASSSGQPDESPGAAALRTCRAKVEAADEVMATARTGMKNWSDHIQAQTDMNAGKITMEEMDDIFDRTRKAGEDDEKQYRAALKGYEDQDGSCSEVSGASAEVTERLARCAERGRAQEPVLAAANDGMDDWTRHLGEMRRSDQGMIHNPQAKWLATWRAAPKHINAYREAADKFSAPDC
jgi:hypothetical protein